MRCVDGRQSGDRATSIGDDHFFTCLDAIDVLAETILQLADPHLRPGSSYVHDLSVATSVTLSTAPRTPPRTESVRPTHIATAVELLQQRIAKPLCVKG